VSDETSNIDPDLARLVDTVNGATGQQEDGWGITLTMHGLTLSGEVIPEWQWLEEAEQQCREGGGDRWASFFAALRQSASESRGESNGDQLIIHLRNTRFFPLGGLMTVPAVELNGFYWRCKLVDVAGWTFGRLAVRDDNQETAA
jgi:hypothetical protein